MLRPLVIAGRDLPLCLAVGQRVAERLCVPLVDATAEKSGWALAEKVRLLGGQGRVVAAGVGALLERASRLALLDGACVVSLGPGREEGTAWTGKEPGQDPLEGQALQECHLGLSGSGDVEALAERVGAFWRRGAIRVAAGRQSYNVEVGVDCLAEQLASVSGLGPVILLVTDRNVRQHQGARIDRALEGVGARVVRAVLEPGERNKNWGALVQIFDAALEGGVDRGSALIAAGGGVVTDMGGFAASCWMRGIRWVGIPTTLLAMVDASVGGKTGVDHGVAKNALGSFWQPRAVFCDVATLRTETERNFRSALAEVVKTGLIGDAGLFETLEDAAPKMLERSEDLLAGVVRRSVRVKARVVGQDERESGVRALLNLGHTVGHALEAVGGFERWTHGEAVSLGLMASLRLGVWLGHTEVGLLDRTRDLLRRLGLPVEVEREQYLAAAEVVGYDKKRRGSSVQFVFARSVGQAQIVPVVLEDLRGLVRRLGEGV